MRSRRRLRQLLGDRRGVTALEYALVAPLLFAILLVSLEFTFMLLADSQLESAAERVTRMGRLGIDGDCGQAVQQVANEMLASWAAGAVHIDVARYTPGENPFDGGPEGQTLCDAGGRGDMVIYRLEFERAALSGVMQWLGLNPFHFERELLIQNEP